MALMSMSSIVDRVSIDGGSRTLIQIVVVLIILDFIQGTFGCGQVWKFALGFHLQ